MTRGWLFQEIFRALGQPKRRTRGLLGRLTAEQKARAYSYDGDMKCGPDRLREELKELRRMLKEADQ